MSALYLPQPAPVVEPQTKLMSRAWTLVFQAMIDAIQVAATAIVDLESGIISGEVTYANRPASPVAGQVANFSDGSTAVWGAAVIGGGANRVAARYNGTAWTVTGK
tara:strand:+ start:230 stop:547 length:318 start_codon:yes stop_codon:yes gene_type:complete